MVRFSFALLAGLGASFLSISAAGVCPGSVASAQPPAQAGADEIRLDSFDRRQRALLAPHLERGPVLLARFYDELSDMPAISLAAYIEAPPEQVTAVITQPTDYPRFMPALDNVTIESSHEGQIAYSWTWQLALFTLQGRNVMTSYGGNATRGYRVDVRSTQGDLGHGRFLWRVHPAGEGRSLVVLSARTDMRGANYMADAMSSGGRSVQRSINIAMSMVMMLGTKREAERLVGYEPVRAEQVELERPNLSPQRMWPLLEQGDLVFLEMDGERLDRVAVLGRSARDLAHTRAIMVDPEEFGRSLVSGSRAEVLETGEDGVLFQWGIPLAIIGVEGRMRLRPSEDVIEVDGVSGSLASSRWRFDTTPINAFDTVVMGWSRYDMRETSPLFRRIIGNDSAFSHGLAVATQVMVVRSLRTRAMRLQ